MGGYSILSASPTLRESRGIRLLPLCGVAISIFFASALAYYHVVLGGVRGPVGTLQGAVAGLHGLVGFMPSFFLALLVLVWSSVLFVSGRIRSPEIRVAAVLVFCLTLSILVFLAQGAGTAGGPVSGGRVGQFFGTRIASMFGGTFVPSLLMGALVLASLVISTDWFFFSYFRGLAGAPAAPKAAPVSVPTEPAAPAAVLAPEDEFPAARKKDSIGLPTPIARDPGEVRAVEDEEAARVEDEVEARSAAEGEEQEQEHEHEVLRSSRILLGSEEEELDEDEAERLDEVLEEGAEPEESEESEAREPEEPAAEERWGPTADEPPAARERRSAADEHGPAAESDEQRPATAGPGPEEVKERAPRRSPSRRRKEPKVETEPTTPADDEARQDVLFEDRSPKGPVLEEAIDLVLTQERASVSFLQRKLRIRFAEASALLDEMEQLGVIGAYDEGSQRPILMTLEQWRSRPR